MAEKVFRRRRGVVVARQLAADELIRLSDTQSVMGRVGEYVVEDGESTRLMNATAFEALYDEVE